MTSGRSPPSQAAWSFPHASTRTSGTRVRRTAPASKIAETLSPCWPCQVNVALAVAKQRLTLITRCCNLRSEKLVFLTENWKLYGLSFNFLQLLIIYIKCMCVCVCVSCLNCAVKIVGSHQHDIDIVAPVDTLCVVLTLHILCRRLCSGMSRLNDYRPAPGPGIHHCVGPGTEVH